MSRYKMREILLDYYFDDDTFFEFSTTGEEFLQSLDKERLVEALDDPEAGYENDSKQSLVELIIAQEDVADLFSEEIEDFYYRRAEQEYAEVQQMIRDELYEYYRGRI